MLEIVEVNHNGIAHELGILSGDFVVSINSEKINDQLDYRFYAAEEYIELLIQRGTQQILFEIEKEFQEDIGIELQEMKMKSCGNNCVFCFVYQNPGGMRKALYFKDEDYRFSFLYGHYVTLTTVNQTELERIVQQQLSPLYISVHSTEEETRKILLGIKKDALLRLRKEKGLPYVSLTRTERIYPAEKFMEWVNQNCVKREIEEDESD